MALGLQGVRDQVVTTINATVPTGGATAVASYGLADTDDLQIAVMLHDFLQEIEDRGSNESQYQVWVVVRKRVTKSDADNVPDLVDCESLTSLVLAIHAAFELDTQLFTSLSDPGGVTLVEKRWYPLFHQKAMDDDSFFFSVLVLTFREWVERT